MYYTGTKEQCEAYNTTVSAGEKYNGIQTKRWADIIEHPNGMDCAIKKHDNYPADLNTLEQLNSAWYPASTGY